MLKKLFGRDEAGAAKGAAPVESTNQKKYHRVLDPKHLLSEPKYAQKVSRVKRSCRATEGIWQKHYLSAIERFASLVQGAPASENHHHSYHGGLVEHTLEALANGGVIAQGYMLPPGVEPEDMISGIDKWHFGVFLSILAHDLGKIVTDIEFVYRVDGGKFIKWHPWSGPMPVGAEYDYRYKPRLKNSTVGKSLHEKAAISLVPFLLTSEAVNWMYSDTELVGQVLNTISASSIGGGAIAEILRKADMASVADSVGVGRELPSGASSTANIALHDKCLTALRRLIDDGDLKKNKPGAAVWITETHTWVVSRPGAEAIKARLLSEGHKGIPNNPVRLFEHLMQAGYALPSEEGEAVWQAEVHDIVKSWTQKLSFLCFENGTLWPSSIPPAIFDGTVTAITKNGAAAPPESSTGESGQQSPEEPASTIEVQAVQEKASPHSTKAALTEEQGEGEQASLSFSSDRPEQEPHQQKTAPKKEWKPKPMSSTSLRGEKLRPHSNATPEAERATERGGKIEYTDDGKNKLSEEQLRENQFFRWLLDGIANRSIKVNEPKAPVHFVEDHLALVTPIVFNKFLEPPLTRKKYELSANGKPLYTLMQKQVCSLGIVSLGPGGRNIVKISVEGSRKKGNLHAILIPRRYFPSLDSFSNNAAITIPQG